MTPYAEFMLFAHELADKNSQLTLLHLKREAAGDEEALAPGAASALYLRLEERLRGMLAKKYPQHGILSAGPLDKTAPEAEKPAGYTAGQEAGAAQNSEFVWCIDPIYGFEAFCAGISVYGALIALAHKGQPVLGIIDHPLTNNRWSGLAGAKTTHNGIPVSASACADLAGAVLAVGNPDSFAPQEEVPFKKLRGQTKAGIYGGNCQAYGRLSMGRIDICLDAGLTPAALCAFAPVVSGAGGVITNWQGQALSLASGPRAAASANPALHEKVLKALQ